MGHTIDTTPCSKQPKTIMMRVLLLVSVALCASAKKAEDPGDCEVCKSVLDRIDQGLTPEMRKDVELIEKSMYKFCKTAKGKDQTMCYYMGEGDSEQGTSGGVKREISSSFSRGVNAKRLCNRLKKIDLAKADLNKMRVKELRKILADYEIPCVGCAEKGDFIAAIRKQLGLKEEV